MNKYLAILFLCCVVVLVQSCDNRGATMTMQEKNKIVESAKETVQKIFDYSNNLDFITGLSLYSDDSDVYFTNNGTIHSLQDLKESYKQIGSSVELLENSIDSWNATVLSKEAVSFTLSIHLKLKLKNIPEYSGELVWSGIVQKRKGKWLVVQSHESWLNCAEVVQALSLNDSD